MLESAIEVLSDPVFVSGFLAGSAVLALGILLAQGSGEQRVLAFGGLLVAGTALIVMLFWGFAGLSQIVGVLLLALAGVFHRPLLLGAVFAIPGAAFTIGLDELATISLVPWVAAIGIVIAAPLVAWFDDRYGASGLPLPLFAISAMGVYLTVPDTEQALTLFAVAAPAGFLGWPRPYARLGAPGAFAAVGVFAYAAAVGAPARPASIIAGMAVLGLLVLAPVIVWLRGPRRPLVLDRIDPVFVLTGQLVLVLLISRTTVRVAAVPTATVMTLGLVAIAAIVLFASGQLPD